MEKIIEDKVNVWDIIEQDYTPNSKDCMETFIPTFHD